MNFVVGTESGVDLAFDLATTDPQATPSVDLVNYDSTACDGANRCSVTTYPQYYRDACDFINTATTGGCSSNFWSLANDFA